MLKFPKNGSFYTNAVTYNDYGEPVSTGALSFNTGVRVKTLSFADAVKATGVVDTGKFYVFTRKNTNTLAVVVGDYIKVDGQTFEITGVDPMYGNRAETMFLVDLVEDPVV